MNTKPIPQRNRLKKITGLWLDSEGMARAWGIPDEVLLLKINEIVNFINKGLPHQKGEGV